MGETVDVILRKYGGRAVVVLPSDVLKDLGLCAGQVMSLSTTGDGKIILSKQWRYCLDELIAQCDRKAPLPEGIRSWDKAVHLGFEAF